MTNWLDNILDATYDEEDPVTPEDYADLEIETANDRIRLFNQMHRASEEGRLHPDLAKDLGLTTGTYPCPTCGMLAWTEDLAERCCTEADIDNNKNCVARLGLYVGFIYDAHQFTYEFKETMKDKGFDSIKGACASVGLDGQLISRIARGDAKFLKRVSWDALYAFFDGPPPGCATIEEYREEDDEP